MTTIRPKVFKDKRKQRTGKGFSRDELKKANSSLKEAVKFGIPIDAKRKTIHDENVEAVKTFLQKKKAVSKPKKPKEQKPKS